MKKLSIIVPVYRAELYLARCVDSLLAQSVEEYEIILVDDGSPDRSGALCDEYAKSHPDIVRCLHIDNGGQGRARNRGIEIAEGEYLGFVDSDDWVEPSLYAKLLAAAERENADVVVCGIRTVRDDGVTASLPVWQEGNPMASAGSACNKLFRRGAVGEIRFPEGLWYEDFAFSAKLLMRSQKTVFLPEDLYDYRIGQESTMNNENARKNLDMLEIMEDLREFTEREGRRDDYEYLLINHVLLDSVNRLTLQHTPEKLEVIWLMRAYVREHIPKLTACAAWQREPRNRRIIMKLNYDGLEDLSKLILNTKKALKKGG